MEAHCKEIRQEPNVENILSRLRMMLSAVGKSDSLSGLNEDEIEKLAGISHVAPFSQVERGSKSLKGQVRWVLPPRSCPTTRN